MIIEITGTQEEKLLQISDALSFLKTALADIADEMEEDDPAVDSMDAALVSVDDAIDCIGDVIDIMETEELALDKAALK